MKIKISAPQRMELDKIRVYAITKLNWIKKNQKKFQLQDRETQRDLVSNESHYYLGKRYLLRVIEVDKPAKVILKHSRIEMHLRSGTDTHKRKIILDDWYRDQLNLVVDSFIDKYEKIMNVKINSSGIRIMKTRWGTCNPDTKRILINLELAKKPLSCIEYIVVHEMVHLLERKHNDRFKAYMDKFMPQWKSYKDELNRLPLGHRSWGY